MCSCLFFDVILFGNYFYFELITSMIIFAPN